MYRSRYPAPTRTLTYLATCAAVMLTGKGAELNAASATGKHHFLTGNWKKFILTHSCIQYLHHNVIYTLSNFGGNKRSLVCFKPSKVMHPTLGDSILYFFLTFWWGIKPTMITIGQKNSFFLFAIMREKGAFLRIIIQSLQRK
jgi:hypothetical protein